MPRVTSLQQDRSYNLIKSDIELDLNGSTYSLLHQNKSLRHYDVILVDGDHEYPQVAIDISFSLSLLEPEGGIIVIDDFHQNNPSNPSRQIVENISRSLNLDIYCVQKYPGSIKSVAMIPFGIYKAKVKRILTPLVSSEIMI